MSKQEHTLKSIQKVSKVGYILSKISYICCIVGVAGCVVGASCLAIFGETTIIKIDGKSIKTLIETESEMSLNNIYATIAVGLIVCAFGIAIARLYQNFFDKELEIGTPFNLDVAKDMKHTGFVTLILEIICVAVASGVHETMRYLLDDVEKLGNDYVYSCGLSITFIVVSLLCKYGAEIQKEQ